MMFSIWKSVRTNVNSKPFKKKKKQCCFIDICHLKPLQLQCQRFSQYCFFKYFFNLFCCYNMNFKYIFLYLKKIKTKKSKNISSLCCAPSGLERPGSRRKQLAEDWLVQLSDWHRGEACAQNGKMIPLFVYKWPLVELRPTAYGLELGQ